MGMARWIRVPRRWWPAGPTGLAVLWLLDAAVMLVAFPAPGEEGLILRPPVPVQRDCMYHGPLGYLIRDAAGTRLIGPLEYCTKDAAPECLGYIAAMTEDRSFGLWLPCFTRIDARLVGWPSSFGDAGAAPWRAEFCTLIAQGRARGNPLYSNPALASVLARGDGGAWQTHLWGIAHDGAFVLLTCLAVGSLARRWTEAATSRALLA